jgi:hypothetical protein
MATKKMMEKLDAILEEAKNTEDEAIATRILDWATTMYPLWILKIFKKDKHLRDILKEDDDLKKILAKTGPMPKLKKCPKCGAKIDDENNLWIQQKFSTLIMGKMDSNGHQELDMEAGYTDLFDWMDSMLSEDGGPEIFGCEKCRGGNDEE